MKKKIKNFKQALISFAKSKYFSYFMICLFSIFLVLPAIFGNYHLGDDMLFHLSSIKTVGDNLPFSIFSKIYPDMAHNFGFGVGIFYPPLAHITGGIIYKIISLFGMGLLRTDTILHFLIFLTSGITMYLLANKVFGDRKKGLFASLFYITYNYFFVDVVIREAISEAFVFIFLPLIFLGIWYLFNENNKKMFYICFISGYIGLMYSHLVMAVWFTIFFLVFLLLFIKKIFKRDNFFPLLFAAIFILIFTSTFTVPMIEHKIFGNYVAFAEDRSVTLGNLWICLFKDFLRNINMLRETVD